MDISGLINNDLANLNDLSLTLKNDRLSIYNTSYIFLKFTCLIGKKTKTYLLIKLKTFFQNQRFGSVKRMHSALLSKNILRLVIPDTRP